LPKPPVTAADASENGSLHTTFPGPLVAGAGPTGLTLAYELARRGVRCRLIDRATVRSDRPKGNCLQTRTLEVFDDMGMVEAMVESGHRAHYTCAYLNGEQRSKRSYDELDSSYPYVLWLAQVGVEQFMEGLVARHGVKVERGIELRGFEARENTVIAELAHLDGKVEYAEVPWLIGSEGAHSTTRHTLGFQFVGESYPGTWAMCEASIDWDLPLENEYTFFSADDTPVFVDPMPDGRFRIVTQSSLDGVNVPEATPEYFERRMRDAHVPFKAIHDVAFCDTYRIHHRQVENLRTGRVFVAGDAAHIFSPVAGQGMNCGIQDAYNLGWKLALVIQGHAPDALLDSYSPERISADAAAMRLSDEETRRYTVHGQHDVDLRRQQFESLADEVGALVSSFTLSEGAELTTNYRDSPIVEEHPPEGGGEHVIQAGDRSPDVLGLRLPDGSEARLFDVLRTPRHVLIVLAGGTDHPDGADGLFATVRGRYEGLIDTWICRRGPGEGERPLGNGELGDPDEELHRRFEVGDAPEVVVVRPDGYIGLRCTLAQADDVTRFLGRILL
jgi:NADPH-dependent dioxygenase